MLVIEGFRPVATKKKVPGNYGVKYRCTPLDNGCFEHCFLFSQRTMREQGWECGDFISVGYDADEEVVGFAKAGSDDPCARKLRKKDASRTGCFLALRGPLGLPEAAESVEVAIVTDEYEAVEQTLLVRLPEATDGGAACRNM